MIEINWRPDARRLRGFGLAAAVVFALLAAWAHLAHRLFGFDLGEAAGPAATALAALALVCGLLAAAWPSGLRPLYAALSAVALPVGWAVGNVLLAIVYYGVVTPIGLAMRLLGRDPLHRRFDRRARSYWIDRPPDDDMRRYFRQF